MLKEEGIEPRMYSVPESDYLADHLVSNLKLKKEVDWKPRVSLREGIKLIKKEYEN